MTPQTQPTCYWVAVRRTYVFTLQEVEKICRTLQSHVMFTAQQAIGSQLKILMKQNCFLFQRTSCNFFSRGLGTNSWLTASNQIVKSLSLSYKKFYFFNMVQPIDLIFCEMVEIIEQNIFNRADFLFRS